MDDNLRRRAVGPFGARSALLTILGEFVLPDYEHVWQETLVRALESVGFSSSAARQAVVRSVRSGWLEASRDGRRSRISLTPETVAMLSTGAERIYGFGEPWSWDGRWLFALLRVPESRRDVRHRLRTRLAWAGMGSIGAGVWISPHADREGEIATIAEAEPEAQLVTFRARPGSVGDPARLIAEAWDLESLAGEYRAFVKRFGRLRPPSEERVFRAQTELVHGWRRFPFLDPELPPQILPASWPQGRALAVFRDRHEAWRQPAREFFARLAALE